MSASIVRTLEGCGGPAQAASGLHSAATEQREFRGRCRVNAGRNRCLRTIPKRPDEFQLTLLGKIRGAYPRTLRQRPLLTIRHLIQAVGLHVEQRSHPRDVPLVR